MRSASMERTRIDGDTHELRSSVPTALEQLGIDLVVRSLAAGDYDVGARTLVERKSTVDLVLSLQSGRLWRQLGMPRRASIFPVLIIEGRPPPVLLGGPAARGLMLAILDQGIAVITSGGQAETAEWIANLARRRQARTPRDRPPFTYRGRHPHERSGERLLCAILGISIHHARALLDRFGSVKAIVDANPDDSTTARGIGPVRARAMARSFGHATQR